jgi:hypothetical protein
MFLPKEIWNMIYRYVIEYRRSWRFGEVRDRLCWCPLEWLSTSDCIIIIRSYVDRQLLDCLIHRMMKGNQRYGTMLYYEYFVLKVD